MSNKVILTSSDLDGYLTDNDHKLLSRMNGYYSEAVEIFKSISSNNDEIPSLHDREKLINIFNTMGEFMKEIVSNEPRISVYSFETPTSFTAKHPVLLPSCVMLKQNTGNFFIIHNVLMSFYLIFRSMAIIRVKKTILLLRHLLIILFRITLFIKYLI